MANFLAKTLDLEGSSVADHAIAAKQALWLEEVLADEHERDRKHSDQIELPECSA
jgi:hypothetical protein